MARTLLAIALATVLIAVAWLRIESGLPPRSELAVAIGLALFPALAMLVRRGWFTAAVTLTGASFVAVSVFFDVPLTEMRPGDEHDFFGPVFDQFEQGFLEYYDTSLPFDGAESPLMHSVLMLAIFGFVAVTAVLLATGLPVLGGFVMLAGIGWAATIFAGDRPLLSGTLLLLGVLGVLFLFHTRRRVARALGPAVAAGLVLAALGVGAASSEAVAKEAFVDWRAWDPYDAPEDPVGVRYVWNSHYQGISFPDDSTVVLRIRVPGDDRRLYWRATTLDEYTGVGWRESLTTGPATLATEIEFTDDPLLPEAALDEDNWIRQEVTVEALADDHLIASAQAVKLESEIGLLVQKSESGVVILPDSLEPGLSYTAWSYVPDARPSELGEAPGVYGRRLARYLEVVPNVRFPSFDARNREQRVNEIFNQESGDFLLSAHRPVYERAREIVGDASSPYLAALALEAWFRTQGGFLYDEQPALPRGSEPPLVWFVLNSQQGYCQHYAGAMAMMLRLLGIPSRVGAGFTSGSYNERRQEWTVSDHNAHTWVEVYFRGYGWIPFDPTPGRGELTAAYSSVSEAFDLENAILPLQTGVAESAVLNTIQREALLSIGGAVTGFPGFVAPGGLGSGVGGDGQGTLPLALLGLASAVMAYILLKFAHRRLRFTSREPRSLSSAYRRDLVGFLADQRLAPPGSATLADLGELVEHQFVVDASPFVRSVSAARFGPPDRRRQAVGQAGRELRILRRRMRRRLGASRRIRGTFSPRSFRV